MTLKRPDLDQQEFADLLGMTRGTVRNYESGVTTRRKPIYMRAWALATGVPIEWLETGQDPRPVGPDGGLDEECAARDSNPEPSDSVIRAGLAWEGLAAA